VAVTVTAVNDNPTAVDDSASVVQNTAATAIPVLANDSSLETGETLTITSVTQGAKGLVAITGAGTGLTYDVNTAATGTDTFTYTIGDGNGGSATATVTITITPPPSLTIDNQDLVEGNSGTKDMIFHVTLSEPVSMPVTVNYATVNGFARAGLDYIATSGTLTFAAGDTMKPVTVKIIGETTKEKNETFALRLSAATNATIARTDGIGNIIDDDSTPVTTLSNTSTKEGGNTTTSGLTGTTSTMMMSMAMATDTLTVGEPVPGEGVLTFAVTLSNASEIPISVDYTTVDLTGKAGVDFQPVSGTLSFAEDETVKYITVPVIGNKVHQLNRRITLRLSNPVELVLETPEAVGEIEDDDPAPAVTVSDASVVEGNSGTVNAVFTVTLADISGKAEMVSYTTADGTATAGRDYTAASGTLTFAPGEVSKTIVVPVIGDTETEAAETFVLNLTQGSDAPLAKRQGIATIADDDVTAVAKTWETSTLADFSAGLVETGGLVTDLGDGAVTLLPANRTEFTGTALPAGWTSSLKSKSGIARVATDTLTLDFATALNSTIYRVNTMAEYRAIFSGAANQYGGFANAQFITKTAGELYARTLGSAGAVETPITVANLFGAAHRFGIRWTTAGISYTVDGAEVAFHPGSVIVTSMTLQFGDIAAAGGGALTIDWARVSPYAATGAFTSPIYNAGAGVTWLSATADAVKPAGTTVTLQVRTGSSPSVDGSWSLWSDASLLAGGSQYIQYRLVLTTTVPDATPVVNGVTITYNGQP